MKDSETKHVKVSVFFIYDVNNDVTLVGEDVHVGSGNAKIIF